MALSGQITAAEIKNRIPSDLIPSTLSDAIVEAYRDQVCGFLEDLLGTTFGASSAYLNSAKYWAINHAAVLAMCYSSTSPDANLSFSPDGELKVSVQSLPKSTATYIKTLLSLSVMSLELLMIKLNPDIPISTTSIAEREA